MSSSSERDAIQSMVLGFRMAELQTLLNFAGKNKSGRKSDLQVK